MLNTKKKNNFHTDLIPHLGSATIETRNKMAVNAAKNIILAFEGKSMLYPTY